MAQAKIITSEHIEWFKERYDFYPLTGEIIWSQSDKNRPKNRGLPAGWIKRCSMKERLARPLSGDTEYRHIRGPDGKPWYAHRVMFAVHYGFCPVVIDHADGNGLNNALSNLIDHTHTGIGSAHVGNLSNKRVKRRGNMDRGVTSIKALGKYRVQIRDPSLGLTVCGKQYKYRNIGYYDTLEEANEAAREARIRIRAPLHRRHTPDDVTCVDIAA